MIENTVMQKRRYSADARRRMSEAHLGKPLTEEHRRNLSESRRGEKNHNYGRKFTPEMRRKMSEAALGRAPWNKGKTGIYSPETLEKMSLAKLGKPLSEETRRKLSEARRGRTFTEEHRHKISEAHYGKKLSEEHKRKISETHRGKKHSEDTRHKMSEARRGELNSAWRGGISFEPYCPAFNDRLKESIRNRDNRTCVLCGASEIQNGQRLSVHHIDADKMQGCNGKNWYLCALCRSCNTRPDTVEKEFLIVSNLNPRRN